MWGMVRVGHPMLLWTGSSRMASFLSQPTTQYTSRGHVDVAELQRRARRRGRSGRGAQAAARPRARRLRRRSDRQEPRRRGRRRRVLAEGEPGRDRSRRTGLRGPRGPGEARAAKRPQLPLRDRRARLPKAGPVRPMLPGNDAPVNQLGSRPQEVEVRSSPHRRRDLASARRSVGPPGTKISLPPNLTFGRCLSPHLPIPSPQESK